MEKKSLASLIAVAVLATVAIFVATQLFENSDTRPSVVSKNVSVETLKIGISPYQDTAMPVLTREFGLFDSFDEVVELVPVDWGKVTSIVASRGETVDVAIGSINTFLPRAKNVNTIGGADVVFYYPLYVFKGASLVFHKDSGLVSYSELLEQKNGDVDAALKLTVEQLVGKRVSVPTGTPYEHMIYALADKAGLTVNEDFVVEHVQLQEGITALKTFSLDVVGAGVTQLTEAKRFGHKPLITMEEMGFAEIVGLMTKRAYAIDHEQQLDKLVLAWFETIRILMSDVEGNSSAVLKYLDEMSSTKYSVQEYKESLNRQFFPRTVEEANSVFMVEDSPFYWKTTWDVLSTFLIKTGEESAPVPYEYFYKKGERLIYSQIKGSE